MQSPYLIEISRGAYKVCILESSQNIRAFCPSPRKWLAGVAEISSKSGGRYVKGHSTIFLSKQSPLITLSLLLIRWHYPPTGTRANVTFCCHQRKEVLFPPLEQSLILLFLLSSSSFLYCSKSPSPALLFVLPLEHFETFTISIYFINLAENYPAFAQSCISSILMSYMEEEIQ